MRNKIFTASKLFFLLVILFKFNSVCFSQNETGVDDTTYFPSQVDTIPTNRSLNAHLAMNLQGMDPPEKYLLEKRSYRFTVTFIVEKDGSVTDIKIGRRYQEELTKEQQTRIINTFRSLPKFSPGTLNGVPVRIRTAQPITLVP